MEYICKACGYKLPSGTKPEDLPSDWRCPKCGAGKDALGVDEEKIKVNPILDADLPDDLSFGQLSVLFGNLANGCEKQGKKNEQALFKTLSDHYNCVIKKESRNVYAKLDCLLEEDLERDFDGAMKEAQTFTDRGAQRALAWTQKVSYAMRSLLKDKDKMVALIGAGKSVHVCQICGFVVVDDDAPNRCPACNVPKSKIKTL